MKIIMEEQYSQGCPGREYQPVFMQKEGESIMYLVPRSNVEAIRSGDYDENSLNGVLRVLTPMREFDTPRDVVARRVKDKRTLNLVIESVQLEATRQTSRAQLD